ncbi:RNA 2',3'-cyclic phosphodiesterase [Candidatus Woesearchaeota archaeon]|nr:RNA 2',3'-cyclic phosphodiesterase [Candidatus Woesearchaeota archaeon]
MPRLFIGIDLPLAVKKRLGNIQHDLHLTNVKLVKPEQMHVTLVFLGEVSAADVVPITKILDGFPFHSFSANVTGISTFPYVIWASIEPEGQFRDLHQAMMMRLPDIKLDFPYHPHITLARSSEKNPVVQAAAFQVIPFTVSSFILYESTLTRNGLIYKEIKKWSV